VLSGIPKVLNIHIKSELNIRGSNRGDCPRASIKQKYISQISLTHFLLYKHERLVCIFSYYKKYAQQKKNCHNIATHMPIARQRLGKEDSNKYANNNRERPLLDNGRVFYGSYSRIYYN
jgi:hypothetical protein